MYPFNAILSLCLFFSNKTVSNTSYLKKEKIERKRHSIDQSACTSSIQIIREANFATTGTNHWEINLSSRTSIWFQKISPNDTDTIGKFIIPYERKKYCSATFSDFSTLYTLKIFLTLTKTLYRQFLLSTLRGSTGKRSWAYSILTEYYISSNQLSKLHIYCDLQMAQYWWVFDFDYCMFKPLHQCKNKFLQSRCGERNGV